MIVLIIVGLILVLFVAARFYLRHWARFFTDAVLQRQNQWYLEEGHHLLNPDWQAGEFTPQEEAFWLLGKTWRCTTADDLELKAKAFVQPSKTWVICVHGYRSNGFQDMSDVAAYYYQKGYSVLVPDLRAHGQSQGEIIGLGWLDRLDLIEWIQQVLTKEPEADILLHGGSMGAAAVLMASGEKLPGNVKGLIADSSYTSVYSEFYWMLQRLTKYPVKRFMVLANSYAKKIAGYSLRQASVTRQLGSNHLPVLFLQGATDQFVPVKETATLMEATAGEKILKIFDNAGHLQAKELYPEEYWQTVEDFITDYLEIS